MVSRSRLRTISIRRHRWCFDDVQHRDWLAGNTAISRWFDVYTLLVPDNESFYIRTLKQCTQNTADELDEAELLNFFREESLHGIAHRAYWPKMRELGIEYDGFLRIVNWFLYSLVEPLQPKRIRLSMVAAIEHINASLANTILKRDLMRVATDSLRELFYWHFAEEIEHKAVAHNVLTRLYPGYFTRVIGALIAFPAFYFLSFSGMVYFLAKEGKLMTRETVMQLYGFWIRDGVLKETLGHLLRYFKPSFEPWSLDDSHLASQAVRLAPKVEADNMSSEQASPLLSRPVSR